MTAALPAAVHAAVVVFDGFDELDAFVVLGLLNRLRTRGWNVQLTSPAGHVTSAGGVTVQAQRPLAWANEADIVLFGSGVYTRAVAGQGELDRLQLDPLRQLIGAQCSGTLMLARLGLLGDQPACTDTPTRPFLVQAGVLVVDEAFRARGPVATAGGRMAAVYLAAWAMWRRAGRDAAAAALRAAAPVGEEDAWVTKALDTVEPFLATG